MMRAERRGLGWLIVALGVFYLIFRGRPAGVAQIAIGGALMLLALFWGVR